MNYDRYCYIYILGNENDTLYIGVTSNLIKRIFEHKQEFVAGFSSKYHLHKLLYFESFESIEEAIKREKQLKNWHRQWKLNLIRQLNPEYKDLYSEIV
jgi:putative endonuclease